MFTYNWGQRKVNIFECNSTFKQSLAAMLIDLFLDSGCFLFAFKNALSRIEIPAGSFEHIIFFFILRTHSIQRIQFGE